MTDLPYLTSDLPGTGGKIKQRIEDFRVEEIPLYSPSGEGTHLYFQVDKWGIPTPEAANRIGRFLGVRPGEVGMAGLKDAQASTSQRMSVEHVDPDRLAGFKDRRMRVTILGRHTNKLRPGHLAGNRFTVRIRNASESDLPAARAVLEVLARRGTPNFFGPQRFGLRGDSAALGRALVAGDLEGFVRLFLGGARPEDPPDTRAARDAFDAGAYRRALDRWPRSFGDQRRALAAYKKRRKAHAAVAAVDKRMKRLYVSAFQSDLFNRVLARRLDTIDRVFAGDWARKTDSGGVFRVEDVQAEQPRVEAFEISPTGPLPGYRCKLAEGEPGRIERDVLAEAGVESESIRKAGSLKVRGARRALRFALGEAEADAGRDEHGPFVEVRFVAPSGCYATVALREITKSF